MSSEYNIDSKWTIANTTGNSTHPNDNYAATRYVRVQYFKRIQMSDGLNLDLKYVTT
jgi:hypothetical protein